MRACEEGSGAVDKGVRTLGAGRVCGSHPLWTSQTPGLAQMVYRMMDVIRESSAYALVRGYHFRLMAHH